MHLAHSPTLIAERGWHSDGRCANSRLIRRAARRLTVWSTVATERKIGSGCAG